MACLCKANTQPKHTFRHTHLNFLLADFLGQHSIVVLDEKTKKN